MLVSPRLVWMSTWEEVSGAGVPAHCFLVMVICRSLASRSRRLCVVVPGVSALVAVALLWGEAAAAGIAAALRSLGLALDRHGKHWATAWPYSRARVAVL